MISEPILTIHGQDPTRWAARHGLRVSDLPCSECSTLLRPSVPFAAGEFRGLRCPPCGCGNQSTPYIVVRAAQYGDLLTRRPRA